MLGADLMFRTVFGITRPHCGSNKLSPRLRQPSPTTRNADSFKHLVSTLILTETQWTVSGDRTYWQCEDCGAEATRKDALTDCC
ncbi:hypothetical protein GCM10025751_22300 [Haladaptatus pallidirubidus]|uniref:DUF8118 domain-containing protein n=1 Tax=Haladaptatus pallidirubidus TaxID=1008152 RepID=A0AAV3UGC8_9EURY